MQPRSIARRAAAGITAVFAAGAMTAAVAVPASADTGSGSGGLMTGSSFGSTGSLGNSDTGSLGIGGNAPTLHTTQDGNKVTVKVTNPPNYLGVCTPVALEASQALRLLDDPGALLSGGPGIHLFAPPIPVVSPDWTATVPNGVYVIAGICGGVGTAGLADVALQLMVVPTGVGSVEPVIDFGSAAGSLGLDALSSTLTGS